MNIEMMLTPYNYTKGNNRSIQYIVMHYVAASGGARANGNYFKNNKLNSSCHYFVGHASEDAVVVQSVEDANTAWHCGSKTYAHPKCRNSNSIGIELCCHNNGAWYFDDSTVTTAAELVRSLMAKYNIPVGNVIRHYDVTRKVCPEPYVRDENAWAAFKAMLSEVTPTPTPTPPPSGNAKYRVNKVAKYTKAQLGAWNDLDKAKAQAENHKNEGYKVFDIATGELVYDPAGSTLDGRKGRINASNLNVRSTPSTSGKILGSLPNGTEVSIVSTQNGWGEISYNGTSGYVFLMYVTPLDGIVTGKTSARLHLREGIGTNSKSIVIMPLGARIEVLWKGGWHCVRYNGTAGYASADYIKL